MQEQSRVVIFAGGVVGASILYHLSKLGCSDAIMLERSKLSSGSTWHAAGGMHTIHGDPSVAKLQQYTIELYKELENLSEQGISLHMTGGIVLAATNERFDWLQSIYAKGKYLGMDDLEIITAQRAHELMPLIDPEQFVGAMYDPIEGHVEPYGVTHAYAKAARKNGASYETHVMVEALSQTADGSWHVKTNKDTIIADYVVNAAGLWAREVGRMMGLELPVLVMEHMYLLTEDMPELFKINASTCTEVLHAVDFEREIFPRQNRTGMLMGTDKKACKPWSETTTPREFGHKLLEPAIDRIAPSLEVGFTHFPAFEKAWIKRIIYGPFNFASDGNPSVGPVKGMTKYWAASNVMAEFSQGGGVRLSLTNWILNRDPGFDVWALDVIRFSDYASMQFTDARVRENHARRFSIRYPNEELQAAKTLLTTPTYDKQKAASAKFGATDGLEIPLWCAPKNTSDMFSWLRSTDFDHVVAEAREVRESVGLSGISGFAKYRMSGRGAADWLDHILACRLPAVGRIVPAPMLKEDGKIIGDFSLSRLDKDNLLIIGSGIAESFHMRWLLTHLPDAGDVEINALGMDLFGLTLAGPKLRDVLQPCVSVDISHDSMPLLAMRQIDIGMTPAIVGRFSYSGDPGDEIWVAPAYLNSLFDQLTTASAAHHICLFGSRLLNALRLKKNCGPGGREYRPTYGPVKTGLDAFVTYDMPASFIDKTGALAEQDSGGTMHLCSFEIEAKDADVFGDKPIAHSGTMVSWVTPGGYAHGAGKSMTQGYVPENIADDDSGWSVELLRQILNTKRQKFPLFDANASRMGS